MNTFKKIMTTALAALSFLAVSCDRNENTEPQEIYLDVNANNISGKWELVEWNGAPLAPGTYVFLDIVRNDRSFKMYQNLDSFNDVPHVVSGLYNLETDPELGAIIRGSYDHDSGEWAHRYIIESLTANEMLWVATDDMSFSQKFVRVDSIPVE